MSRAHLVGKCRDAVRGGQRAWGGMSTGEQVAVALVLNRADWLQAAGYTIPEAIDRVGPEWVELVPEVARQIRREVDDGDLPSPQG